MPDTLVFFISFAQIASDSNAAKLSGVCHNVVKAKVRVIIITVGVKWERRPISV